MTSYRYRAIKDADIPKEKYLLSHTPELCDRCSTSTASADQFVLFINDWGEKLIYCPTCVELEKRFQTKHDRKSHFQCYDIVSEAPRHRG